MLVTPQYQGEVTHLATWNSNNAIVKRGVIFHGSNFVDVCCPLYLLVNHNAINDTVFYDDQKLENVHVFDISSYIFGIPSFTETIQNPKTLAHWPPRRWSKVQFPHDDQGVVFGVARRRVTYQATRRYDWWLSLMAWDFPDGGLGSNKYRQIVYRNRDVCHT